MNAEFRIMNDESKEVNSVQCSAFSVQHASIWIVCALLVAGFGAFLGYLSWNTYANNTLIYSYPLIWGDAKWLATQTEAPQGYFRKTLYIPRKINHAWIKVAAPDSYLVMVNGIKVAKKTFHSINISGLHDITGYLKKGKNVVSVLVRRSTYPGTSEILVEGSYLDELNQETRFVSDDTWRVKIVEERQGNGKILWTTPLFDDSNWPFAKVLGPADMRKVYPLNVDYSATEESVTSIEIPPTHPELILKAPLGKWIWHPDPEVRTAYFEKLLDLSSRIREVWIRVAASQRYSLAINGMKVVSTDQSINAGRTGFSSTSTGLPMALDPADARGTEANPLTPTSPEESSEASTKTMSTTGSLDIYNITPFVHMGSNSVGISVHGERSFQALLVDGLIVYQDGRTFWFQSDPSWNCEPLADSRGIQQVSIQYTTSYQDITKPAELRTNAVIVGSYPNLPWGLLNKSPKVLILPSNLRTLALISMGSYMLAGILISLSFWVLSAYLQWAVGRSKELSITVHRSLTNALILDTLAHIPSTLFLGVCYLLQFDVRFDYSFPFQPWILAVAILILVGFKLALVFEAKGERGKGKGNFSSHLLPFAFRLPPDVLTLKTLEENKKFYLSCLLIIAVCGIWLRLQNIDYESINGDECGTLRDALSILVRGYPFRSSGPYEKPVVTYELLPYPIALSFLLFGVSDFALRLPSAVYGIFSIFLFFYVGSKLFNRRIGLLASAIFAFMPLSIHWAQNDRYPQPTHTLGLLVSYLFYQAINKESIKPQHIYPVAILYAWMFLTWEGTGFFLGALCLGLIMVKWKNYKWLKERHLWGALIGIGIIVLVQMMRRRMYNARYLAVGEGRLAGVTLSPIFLDPLYDPYYYTENFFWAENHFILTLLSLAGLPLFIVNPGLRYFAAILVTVWLFFTNLFPLPTSRYLYHIQPYLIFLAVATCVYYGDYLISLGKGIVSRVKEYLNTIILVGPLLILFLSTNPFVLQLYRLAYSPNIPVVDTRYRTYQSDQKTSNQYIRDHLQDGDFVIASTQDVTKYYAGQVHAFMESLPSIKVGYAEEDETFKFPGKRPDSDQPEIRLMSLLGVRVLLGLDDLKEAMNKHHRIWISAVPNAMFTKLNAPDVLNYINMNFKVVHESYNARIYLWEK